jgi:hypothetical protein
MRFFTLYADLGSQTSFFMENHPIPQDVTGFQFKLIGDMTVKQFAYLATGIVLAVVLFQIPVNFLIKFPFCAFFAIFGIALAYFPVSGRPMDLMIGNYIKALIKPTVFIYDKTENQTNPPDRTFPTDTKDLSILSGTAGLFPKDQLKIYLETKDAKPKTKVDEIEDNFLTSVANLANENPPYQSFPTPAVNVPQMAPQPNPVIRNEPALQATAAIMPTPPILPTPKQETPQRPPAPLGPAILSKPIPAMSRTSTIDAPTSPNLIVGVTKDARGNTLSNILVEIKDKDNNPVRAFKTNGLGRFASATPLINGTYTIEFEDPKAQNKFEKIVINITGGIMPPVEAISIDMREELRRSLFAPNIPTSQGGQNN